MYHFSMRQWKDQQISPTMQCMFLLNSDLNYFLHERYKVADKILHWLPNSIIRIAIVSKDPLVHLFQGMVRFQLQRDTEPQIYRHFMFSVVINFTGNYRQEVKSAIKTSHQHTHFQTKAVYFN